MEVFVSNDHCSVEDIREYIGGGMGHLDFDVRVAAISAVDKLILDGERVPTPDEEIEREIKEVVPGKEWTF